MSFFLENGMTRVEYYKTVGTKTREEYKDLLRSNIRKHQKLASEASKDRKVRSDGRDLYSEICGVVSGLSLALELFQEEEFKE